MAAALPHLPLSTQLIGVDGGASGVRAFDVELVERADGRWLRADSASIARDWPQTASWRTPAQRNASSVLELGPIDAQEEDQAWKRVETTARCVLELARKRGAARVLVGVAMPGVKTVDERGIAFARHGPRCPQFLDRLQTLLSSEGLELVEPLARLYSDGWCAGLGEEFAEEGLLRGAPCAYYLGGGSGLAEALKLSGELVSLDAVQTWFPKAWQMSDAEALLSYDDLISARGINALWNEQQPELAAWPEDCAESSPAARNLFEAVGAALARLVVERVISLRARGPLEESWPGPHELARVVIGLRLGRLLGDERTRSCFEHVYCETAPKLLEARRLHGVHWVTRISTLDAAPAIGAAAAALLESRGHG